nr:MAG TPA: hypothetical protein [Caudoviricetes sp.]
MIKFRLGNELKQFENLEELFKTRRQERNKIFGTYLTDLGDKNLDKEALIEKVGGQITTLEDYQQNLKQLLEVVEDELSTEKSEKVVEDLGTALENPRTKERAIEKLKELGIIQ